MKGILLHITPRSINIPYINDLSNTFFASAKTRNLPAENKI